MRFHLPALALLVTVPCAACGSMTSTGTGTSHTKAAQAIQTIRTINVHGTLTLTLYVKKTGGTGCAGSGGTADVRAGLAVTVGNQRGEVLGVAPLGVGALDASAPHLSCVFPFSVDVAATSAYYVLKVAHGGSTTWSAQEVLSPVRLAIGG